MDNQSTNMKQPLLATSEARKSLTVTDKLLGHKVPKAPVGAERDFTIAILSTHIDGADGFHTGYRYEQNVIVSSRYTLLNFLPKSLLEQFRRLANVYFLVVGAIAIIGTYTSSYETAVQPEGMLGPLCLVVLISVLKDGVEDMKRHNQDNKINSKTAKRIELSISADQDEAEERISGGRTAAITHTTWQELRVGDSIFIEGDDEVPADCAVLCCGGIQGPICYVETAAIDGETNLKIKYPSIPSSPATAAGASTAVRCDRVALSADKKKVTGLPLFARTILSVEPPNGSIHRFNGKMEVLPQESANASSTFMLAEKNLLLRGSVLRASEWCVATVVYTGADTKLSLNSKKTPSKLSSIDRIVNKTLLIAISTMILVCFLSMIFASEWNLHNGDAKYLCLKKDDLDSLYPNGGGCESSTTSSGLTFFTFVTLYNNFVCISMYVSLEMVYLCQSFFLSNDLELYDASTDTPAECHTSGASADLGQVQYVLSDKTGTLTKNQMVVKQFSIADKVFGDNSSFADDEDDNADNNPDPACTIETLPFSALQNSTGVSSEEASLRADFLRVLTYCHTAMLMPDERGDVNVRSAADLEKCLQAESPDEVALILVVAQECGILLRKKSDDEMTSTGLDHYCGRADSTEQDVVEIVAVNGFDSDRKMMSMLVRLPREGGRLVLLCKGADSSMLRACNSSLNPHTATCTSHINAFASTGLRTLVAGCRDVSEQEAAAWLKEYRLASNSISERSELLFECAKKIEKDMRMLGCIGIEDELQDGVPEAVEVLHAAGLNVWMITGDKAETAIAIAKKCRLLDGKRQYLEKIISLSGEPLRQKLYDLHSTLAEAASPASSADNQASAAVRESTTESSRESISYASKGKEISLIVDGGSLEGLWASQDLKALFVDVVRRVPTVIASRVSPLQKAALVRMIKTGPGKPITLAIGDGANDVGMIHESRVGVGISGKEGRHAANSADFAVSQFRFIVPLLMHHGRYNYIRCSKLVLYSFFKNLLLVGILFYYCFYSGFSGSIPLDTIVFSGYNFYLGLPIMVVGAFDCDVSRADVLRHPALAYNTGRLGEMLNLKNMAKWCLFPFCQGLLLFVLAARFCSGPLYARSSVGGLFDFTIYGTGLNSLDNGWSYGLYVEGFLIYSVAIAAMQLKVVAMHSNPNIIFWGLWLLSFAGYFFFTFLYGLSPSLYWYNTVPLAMSQPQFWLALMLVPVVLCVSDAAFDAVWSVLYPSSSDRLLQMLQNETAPSAATAGSLHARAKQPTMNPLL